MSNIQSVCSTHDSTLVDHLTYPTGKSYFSITKPEFSERPSKVLQRYEFPAGKINWDFAMGTIIKSHPLAGEDSDPFTGLSHRYLRTEVFVSREKGPTDTVGIKLQLTGEDCFVVSCTLLRSRTSPCQSSILFQSRIPPSKTFVPFRNHLTEPRRRSSPFQASNSETRGRQIKRV